MCVHAGLVGWLLANCWCSCCYFFIWKYCCCEIFDVLVTVYLEQLCDLSHNIRTYADVPTIVCLCVQMLTDLYKENIFIIIYICVDVDRLKFLIIYIWQAAGKVVL